MHTKAVTDSTLFANPMLVEILPESHLEDLQELIEDEDTATKPYVHKPLVAQALCSQALHGRPVWRYPYNYQLLWPTDH